MGTGINTDPRFAAKAITKISKATGIKFREAEDHFEAQGAKDAFVSASGGPERLCGRADESRGRHPLDGEWPHLGNRRDPLAGSFSPEARSCQAR